MSNKGSAKMIDEGEDSRRSKKSVGRRSMPHYLDKIGSEFVAA